MYLAYVYFPSQYEMPLLAGQGFHFGSDIHCTVDSVEPWKIRITRGQTLLKGFFPKGISHVSAVVGENGSGKSLLLVNLIGRKDEPRPISVFWDEAQQCAYTSERDISLFVCQPDFSLESYSEDPDVQFRHYSSSFVDIPHNTQWQVGSNLGDLRDGELRESRRRVMLYQRWTEYAPTNDKIPIPSHLCLNIGEGNPKTRLQLSWAALKASNYLFPEEIEKIRPQIESIINHVWESGRIDSQGNWKRKLSQKAIGLLVRDTILGRSHGGLEPTNEDLVLILDSISIHMETHEQIDFGSLANALEGIIKNENREIGWRIKAYIDDLKELANAITTISSLEDQDFVWIGLEVPVTATNMKLAGVAINCILRGGDYIHELVSLEFTPPLSSGEEAMHKIFSRIIGIRESDGCEVSFKNQKLCFLLDEGDAFFHPEWQRRYLTEVLTFLSSYFTDAASIQVILATHSPFIVADLPTSCIVLLSPTSRPFKQIPVPTETFGANIHSLLSQAMFLESTMGAFAAEKINQVIKYLKPLKYEQCVERLSKEEHTKQRGNPIENPPAMTPEIAQAYIDLIGEPILKKHLQLMLNDVTKEVKNPQKRSKKEIQADIERLQQELTKQEEEE